ncbi:major outer membrane protein [uncultured Campylobacter sp.]|uniref:major outer membrane protein n=1 Tax=uncultured Campylobacter sp. TaxID=218934 RepID=UPI00261FBEC1|nr:major outer membrane protein [uncultured Campylobacter sp.]
MRILLVLTLFFTSFSLAKPLEEAIKNVEISGEIRYRYEHSNNDKMVAPRNSDGARTRMNITIPLN